MSILHRRRYLLLALAACAAVATSAVLGLRIRGGSGPAVTPVGTSAGDQLHQFNGDHHAPFISIAEFKPIYDRHDPSYLLIDVREANERARIRIPGDVWAPLADADSTGWRFLQQYTGKILVLYCDCPWQEAAQESVMLEAKGFDDRNLRVLHEGIPGWYQAGYATDTSPIKPCAVHHWPQACYYL